MDRTETDSIEGREADHRSIPLSVAIVDAVVTQEDIAEDELEPLYEFVDPDAIDALFASRSTGTGRFTGTVQFRYNNYWITVTVNREIEVEPTEKMD